MGTKRPKKALLEVIPPRIYVTFRRCSFWFRPKTSKMRIGKPRPENTTNTVSGSRPDFSEKSENHENRLELDPYSTSRAENQAIWNLKVLWIQWDPSRPPKLPYKIQNRPKIQWIQPGTVYTKLFRQFYALNVGRFRKPSLEKNLVKYDIFDDVDENRIMLCSI